MVEMETIVSLCKRRGFVFQSSEIYGGIGGFWDYGPLGVELKNNIKRAWWKEVVQERDDVFGVDAAIIMNPNVWRASGHVETFSDPLVECKTCHHRFRADQLTSDACPNCGNRTLTEARQFNLLFRTFVGPVEDEAAIAYLRPETAQGIFVNFQNVQQSMRAKLPFGIAQIGRAFRNEIVTGNFIFRDREFEQMELEYFVKPGTEDEWHAHWRDLRVDWWCRTFNIQSEHIRVRALPKDELAHYSRGTFEIEYQFPMGWSEIEGVASRTDYDLARHSQFSGKELQYFDDETKEKYVPYVIEPSAGVDRAVLVALFESYYEEKVRGDKRVVLKFPYALAPVKVAILPLLRNRPELVSLARDLATELRPHMTTMYDDTASIGRLYRRQDEIGTPFCVTVDVQSLEDKEVTIRHRDSMEQIRLPLAEVKKVLAQKLATSEAMKSEAESPLLWRQQSDGDLH
jgi:glycyl-tRNA synthetase